MTTHGLRLHLVHGHLLGARKKWKGWMETREFKSAFELLPGPVAGLLDQLLERKNRSGLADDEHRHLASFRPMRPSSGARPISWSLAMSTARSTIPDSDPRMIVLGGWQDGQVI